MPRRSFLVVSSENQRSTRLSQLELVGVKCRTNRGCVVSQRFTAGVLCVEALSRTTWQSRSAGTCWWIVFKKARNSWERCRACREPITTGRRRIAWVDETRRNLRYAIRTLARTPSFTLTAIFTLALTIGANTAIFSVVDAVLLRPLPYRDPDRLAAVGTLVEGRGMRDTSYSADGRTFFQLRDHGRDAFDIAATSGGFTGVNLAAGGHAEYVQQQRVSTGFFRLIGVPPHVGREFDAGEDRDGGPAAVILSDGLWRRLFAADRRVVGKTVMVRGEAATIVGVMPPGFQGLFRADLWTPLRPSTTGEGSGDNYFVVARLRSSVTWPEAMSRAAAIAAPVLADSRTPSDIHRQVVLAPLQQGASSDLRTPLLVLWGAVGVVLLIGCANVAGLLLARGATRTRELATRAALGAGSAALMRQLLTESVVLAIVGSVAGTAVGAGLTRLLAGLAAQQFDIWQDIRLDARVLAMTVFVAMATALAFGLYPALRAVGSDAWYGAGRRRFARHCGQPLAVAAAPARRR